MASIRVEKLVKSFGAVRALKGVDLEVNAGELFFLLGPSGCGKTTLLRSLAGFCEPDSGRILFADKDVTRLAAHRRESAMVFQNYALWPHLSVFENVAFGLEQRRCSRDEIRTRVMEALERVRLSEQKDRKPNALSGGQQQRVALARALVVRPQCLLLDEPLSNLDAKLRLEMRLEIRRLCKEFNLTSVYVTHDQEEALSVADRIAVFAEGEILQVGTPLEVYRRPRTRHVADFIGGTNMLPGRVVRAEYGEALIETAIGEVRGVLVDPEMDLGAGQQVTVSIRPEALKLDSFPADENCVTGRIAETAYFGQMAEYRLRIGEIDLRVSELNPRHVGSRGQAELYAWFDPEDAVVLID